MGEDDSTKKFKTGESQGVEMKAVTGARSIHKICPLGMRVVVRIPPAENRTEAGLFLPEGAKEEMQESVLAQVVEVAVAHDDETDDETNISGIPHNSWVLISKYIGIKVPWDDSLRIVETADVLAVVNHITLS